MTRIGDHAVVLGGSMAGIMTARVLAQRYSRVTVVDRDRFPEAGIHRRGVPQGRHIHALQARGAQVIERLFPGVTEELVDEGAYLGDWGTHSTMSFLGQRLSPVDAGLELLAASRPLLEGHLRQRLAAIANVTMRDGCDVRGVTADDTGSVTGVRLLPRRVGSTEEQLAADLVVDATGRGSRLPRWLEDIGFPTPRVDETGLEVTYTSCVYPRRPDDDDDRYAILIGANPPGLRGGGAIAAEGDSWVVTLGGVLGEHAPTDIPGFVDFAATLPEPDLHEIVRDREPLSEPVLMRYPSSRRRRYELLDELPAGLVVTGDALCSFNPVYGQGMSVAAVEAVTLGRCLDEGSDAIGRRFLDAVSPLVDDAWDMVSAGDARFTSQGRPPLAARLVGRYRSRVMEAATHDARVSLAFREVMAMTARPSSLLRPSVALRVLTAPWRRRVGARLRPVTRGRAARAPTATT